MHNLMIVADFIFSTALFVHGFLFIPQAIKIWQHHSAKDLSLITFLGFNAVQASATLHGFFHHDFILMIGTGFSLITCGFVTFSILYYRLIRRQK